MSDEAEELMKEEIICPNCGETMKTVGKVKSCEECGYEESE